MLMIISSAFIFISTETESIEAAEVQPSSNLEFNYNPVNKVLTISGMGATMGNMWTSADDVPWKIYNDAETVDIRYGVTNIGPYAFAGFTSLETVHIPSSVKGKTGGTISIEAIGDYAFKGCTSLKDMYLYHPYAPGNTETGGYNDTVSYAYQFSGKAFDMGAVCSGIVVHGHSSWIKDHKDYFIAAGLNESYFSVDYEFGKSFFDAGKTDEEKDASGYYLHELRYFQDAQNNVHFFGPYNLDKSDRVGQSMKNPNVDLNTNPTTIWSSFILEEGVNYVEDPENRSRPGIRYMEYSELILPVDFYSELPTLNVLNNDNLAAIKMNVRVTGFSGGYGLYNEFMSYDETYTPVSDGRYDNVRPGILWEPSSGNVLACSSTESIEYFNETRFNTYSLAETSLRNLSNMTIVTSGPTTDTGSSFRGLLSVGGSLDSASTGIAAREIYVEGDFGPNLGTITHNCSTKYVIITSSFSSAHSFYMKPLSETEGAYIYYNDASTASKISRNLGENILIMGDYQISSLYSREQYPTDCWYLGSTTSSDRATYGSFGMNKTVYFIPSTDTTAGHETTLITGTLKGNSNIKYSYYVDSAGVKYLWFYLVSQSGNTAMPDMSADYFGNPTVNSALSTMDRVFIGKGISSIGSNVFKNCSELDFVGLPYSLTSIGESAFESCSNLTTPLFLTSLTSIGDNAFKNCDSFTKIYIGSSCSIGESAFESCDNLTNVHLSPEVHGIGEKAFYSCTCLAKVTWLMKSAGTVGNQAFITSSTALQIEIYTVNQPVISGKYDVETTGISLIDSTNKCGQSAYYEYDPDTRTLTIFGSGQMYTYSSTNIPKYSALKQSIEKVVIRGISGIGAESFLSCSRLEEVTVSGSVKAIGANAFAGCTSLNALTVPLGLNLQATSQASSYFEGCKGITSITFIASDNGSFVNYNSNDCTPWMVTDKMVSVVFTDGLNTIPQGIFANCVRLNEVTVPSTITTIGKMAFYGCESLYSIVIPEGVSSVNDNVFSNCYRLVEIYDLTSIASKSWYPLNHLIINTDSETSSAIVRTNGLVTATTNGTTYIIDDIADTTSIKIDNLTTSHAFNKYAFYDRHFTSITLLPAEDQPLIQIGAEGSDMCFETKGNTLIASSAAIIHSIENADADYLYTDATTVSLTTTDAGDHITWYIDSGVLHLDGYGEMSKTSDHWGWHGVESTITDIVIDKRIYGIGEGSFADFNNLASIEMSGHFLAAILWSLAPDGNLYTIGSGAFDTVNGISTVKVHMDGTDECTFRVTEGFDFQQVGNMIVCNGAVWKDSSGRWVTSFQDDGVYTSSELSGYTTNDYSASLTTTM